MLYTKNWEMSKKRLTAFWNQEVIDRCCINVTATKGDYQYPPVPEEANAMRRFWLDPEQIVKNNRSIMEHTYYAGDAFPNVFLNLGASGHAGFFKGAKYRCSLSSIWFDASLKNLDEMEFDKNTELYQKTLEIARALAEDSRGDYVVSMPDTSGNADALAHLIGSENLLPIMLEDPDSVQRAMAKAQTAYENIIRDVYSIVRDVNDGGSNIGWLYTWAPGLSAQMQCDMSVMISNQMYKEFIVDELRQQTEFLDYALYHLDGMEQIRHLDDLLALPKLRAIQWTQVAGQPPCTEFFDQLKKIQAAGKSLVILAQPNQVETLLTNLSSRGLFLKVWARSPEEADELVKMAERLTHE